MRGPGIQQDTLFSTVSPEQRVAKDYPLRPIWRMVDEAPKALDEEFKALYADLGRDPIPPKKLLRAQLLMALYSIRSEKGSRETHESKTDLDTLLCRKSKGTTAKLICMGHLLRESRHELVVDAQVSQTTGIAEGEASITLIEVFTGTRRVTAGADKNDDIKSFVDAMRCVNATPHVAQNGTNRSLPIDGRTSCHPGYRTSQAIRRRIEECLGWFKTIGGLSKSRFVGHEKLDFRFVAGSSCLQPNSDTQSGGGAVLMMGIRGLGVLGNRKIGLNWLISSQRAGIIMPHALLAARKAAPVRIFSKAC